MFFVFSSFEKIFSLNMFSKIQPNAFLSPFFISSENENRKQSNQTTPKTSKMFTRGTWNIDMWLKRTYFYNIVNRIDRKL